MTLRTKDAAELLGIHPQTLRRWEKEGKIEPQRVNNQRRYLLTDIKRLKGDGGNNTDNKRNIIYGRVSSRKQSEDLSRQIEFMQKIFPDYEVITDIGSGVNFKRQGLQTLLERICKGEIGKIAIAYKDRLARIGFELFEEICKIFGCEIIIVNNIETSPENELVEDLIAITTSFSARIHGLRKYANEMSNDKTFEQENIAENLDKLG